jgi:hypothetical protein
MRLSNGVRAPSFPALSVRAATCLGAAVLALGACTPDPEEKAPQCPVALVRPDAATLTRYDGRGTDLTNLVLSGRLLEVKGACKGLLGHNVLKAQTQLQMVLTRGPAATGRDVDVPYIVAIMKDGNVLERRELVQHVTFPANVDTVQVTADPTQYAFPTRRGLGGQNYTIYFLFRLTPEELATNRRALRLK